MNNSERIIKDFFAAYETNFGKALAGSVDAKLTASAFADCCIAASPRGVSCGNNDKKFLENILQGYAFYREIGTKSMKISSLTISELDEIHFMCKVRWESFYERPGIKEEIDFDVIYLLQLITGRAKIFAYITGDEQKSL